MSALTVYNHGTGGSSTKGYDKLEIVNCFGNQHATSDPGGKYKYWLITEGVGSKLDPADVGRLEWDSASGTLRPKKKGRTSGLKKLWHSAAGTGVQENVENLKAVLQYLKAAKQLPTTINMIGWSRGAVTCIRQAYELWRDADLGVAHIPINIFAVDPVAGGGADAERQGSVIYPNVRNFIDVLATGERRRAFYPKTQQSLSIVDSSATSAAFVHFPGIHSDVAKISGEPGIVVFDMCSRFLDHCGTSVPAHDGFQSQPDRLLQCYFNMVLGSKRIGTDVLSDGPTKRTKGWTNKSKGMMNRVKGGGPFKERNLAVEQVSGEDALVNIHHEALFEKHYPALYDLCFRSNLPPFEWQQAFNGPRHQTALRRLELYSPGVTGLLGRTNRSVTRADEQAWRGVLNTCGLVP